MRLVFKATQFGLFGGEDVIAPGSRGGKFYRTKRGKVRYGEKPAPVAPRVAGYEPDRDALREALRPPPARAPSPPLAETVLRDDWLDAMNVIEEQIKDREDIGYDRHFTGQIDGRRFGPNRVVVDKDALCVRTARIVATVLKEAEAKGFAMPGSVMVARFAASTSGASAPDIPRGETITAEGGKTQDDILTVRLPAALPDDADPDQVVATAFGGQVTIWPYGKIDSFAVRNMHEMVLHELGHCLAFDRQRKRGTRLRSIGSGEDPHEAIPAERKDAAASVSEYAMTDVGEFIAEAFTRLYRGETLTPAAAAYYRELDGPAWRRWVKEP